MPAPIHLQPTAELAERVLLPGDPGRALRLAQLLMDQPIMFNHNRGLWGYTGRAGDGELLTIQSTGMGGPSASIVIAELADLGARRLVRVGTCGALDRTLRLGEVLLAEAALSADGASRALGASGRVPASPAMFAALAGAAGGEVRAGLVASTDLFYDTGAEEPRRWIAAGAVAVEMECATLFRLAARRGLEAGALLVVSDTVLPKRVRIDPDGLAAAEERVRIDPDGLATAEERVRIDPDGLAAAEERMGRLAAGALEASSPG